jgi:anti-anti-sigma factor
VKVTYAMLEGNVALVKPEGRLDAATVPAFEETLKRLLAEKHSRLVINLTQVNYISSSGLRAMLTARRQARAQGGDLILCCMPPRVQQVFDMVGFSSVFGVYENPEQAALTLIK